MKTLTLLLLIILGANILMAQDLSQTVKGKVIDIDNHMPLIGVTVILLDSDPMIGTTTDIEGNFKFDKVPVGRQSFKFTYIGYEESYRSNVMIASGREVVLNIEMRETVFKMKEVSIKANKNNGEAINQMAHISTKQITVESTSRTAAGINDPARTVQSFAGVATQDDENNELVIRGNSPRGMLWRMEGVEIPNPNHFTNGEGGSGGAVTVLSSQVLSNSDFFTSAFPAEYGNALSGVFDLKMRNGNTEKREYALQLGIMGAQIAAEGPFVLGKKASYLVNYRYSTLTMLTKLGIDISGGDIIPEFQDLSYKLYFPTKHAGTISIWGLGGISSAGFNAIMDSSLWVYRGDRYSEKENHRMGVSGITHSYILKNNKSYIKTVAAVSYSMNQLMQDTLGYEYNKAIIFDENFTYKSFKLNSYFNYKFNSQHTIRTGFNYSNQGFDLYAKHYNYEENYLEKKIENEGNTDMIQAYGQWNYRINKSLDLVSGVHYTYLFLNNDNAIEPRLSFKWKINSSHIFTAGAGLHSKAEPVSIYLAEKQHADGSITTPNKNLGITKAAHSVIGYQWNFAPDYTFKVETYYQYLYDVPVNNLDTTGTVSALNFATGFTNDQFSNKGTGRNYGVEITIEKYFSNDYYFMFTSSLFESKYTMPDGIERNTFFNNNYIFNLTGGKEFKVGKDKQNILGLNGRIIWKGGNRAIPINLEKSIAANHEIRDYTMAFENRKPDYFRIDFGISYQKNKPDWSWIVSLDLQNATNRGNIWGDYYNPETKKVEEYTYLGLIPVLNYRIEF